MAVVADSGGAGETGQKTVVVLGGYGFFGRLVVQDLLRFTSSHLIVAGRRPPRGMDFDGRVTVHRCDIRNLAVLETLLTDAWIVVHCAGPYQRLELNPLRAAISRGVHYVDLADDREFVRRVGDLDDEARKAAITVMTGMSVVPGMSALVTNVLTTRFDELESVRTFVAPGTSGSRGDATLWSLLSGAGREFFIPRAGREYLVCGWTEPEWVEFPPPVGRRLEYLAIPVADFDILPKYFGVRTVEFKAGSEFPLLNRMLSLIARVRARTGHPNLERWASTIRRLVWFVGLFGTDQGGVVVELVGCKDGKRHEIRFAVVAETGGERIPAVLAGIAVSELLDERLAARGVVAHHSWLTPTQFIDQLRRRGLRLYWKQPSSARWEQLSAVPNPSSEQ